MLCKSLHEAAARGYIHEMQEMFDSPQGYFEHSRRRHLSAEAKRDIAATDQHLSDSMGLVDEVASGAVYMGMLVTALPIHVTATLFQKVGNALTLTNISDEDVESVSISPIIRNTLHIAHAGVWSIRQDWFPIDYAAARGQTEAVKLLLRRGCRSENFLLVAQHFGKSELIRQIEEFVGIHSDVLQDRDCFDVGYRRYKVAQSVEEKYAAPVRADREAKLQVKNEKIRVLEEKVSEVHGLINPNQAAELEPEQVNVLNLPDVHLNHVEQDGEQRDGVAPANPEPTALQCLDQIGDHIKATRETVSSSAQVQSRLERQIEIAKEALREKEEAQTALGEQAVQHARQLQKKDDEIKAVTHKLTQLKSQQRDSSQQLKTLTHQHKNNVHQLRVKQQEITALEAKISTIQQEKTKLLESKLSLKEQMKLSAQERKQQHATIEALEKQLLEQGQTKAALDEKATQTVQQLDEKKREVKVLTQQRDKLQNQARQFDRKLELVHRQHQADLQELQTRQQLLEEKKARILELTARVLSLEEKQEVASRQLVQLQHTNKDLLQQVDHRYSNITAMRIQLEQVQTEKVQLETRCQLLSQQLQQRDSAIAVKAQEIEGPTSDQKLVQPSVGPQEALADQSIAESGPLQPGMAVVAPLPRTSVVATFPSSQVLKINVPLCPNTAAGIVGEKHGEAKEADANKVDIGWVDWILSERSGEGHPQHDAWRKSNGMFFIPLIMRKRSILVGNTKTRCIDQQDRKKESSTNRVGSELYPSHLRKIEKGELIGSIGGCFEIAEKLDSSSKARESKGYNDLCSKQGHKALGQWLNAIASNKAAVIKQQASIWQLLIEFDVYLQHVENDPQQSEATDAYRELLKEAVDEWVEVLCQLSINKNKEKFQVLKEISAFSAQVNELLCSRASETTLLAILSYHELTIQFTDNLLISLSQKDPLYARCFLLFDHLQNRLMRPSRDSSTRHEEYFFRSFPGLDRDKIVALCGPQQFYKKMAENCRLKSQVEEAILVPQAGEEDWSENDSEDMGEKASFGM